MIPFLSKKGAKINYYDPSGEKKEFSKLKNVSFLNDIRESCLNSDLIIIHTEWDEFKTLDFKKICRNKKVKIYDMRNLYSPKKMKKIGITYYSIGR
jgi:UDPglucose 6-dehydrogenase